MSATLKSSFANTLSALDELIKKLEVNTGLTEATARKQFPERFTTTKTNSSQVVAPKEEVKTNAEPVKAKKEEKQATTQPKTETKEGSKEALPPATLEDFAKLDIRVGKIKECWKHESSDKLYCERIDIGSEVREIGSGLQQFVPINEMTEGLVLVLANLKPRKLAGFNSNGMVLCAGNHEHTKVELLRPAEGSKIGERVVLDGYDKITQEMEKVIDPKKKILEIVFPEFKTDAEGYATFLGRRLKTSAGYIKAKTLTNCPIS